MSKILGIGHCLPGQPVTNAEIALLLGGAADLEGRIGASGALSRHFADEGQGPSDLAKIAAESALREAGLAATDIELLIFATMTPDVTFPGSGCYLQDKLGCGTIGALDVRAQCAGLRISQMVAMALELDEDRMFNNIDRYGNTTAASIPLALYEAAEQGRVQVGALVCLAAFGAGFTWASALIRW